MSAFSESALERKLSELSNSQQSVQTLSLWLIHHRKHSTLIVTVWERELRKGEGRMGDPRGVGHPSLACPPSLRGGLVFPLRI
uniref:CID domain-containing protein n=1 Tax=Laticauda laticaudata TaxID=8630 RepID=A0A8C5RW39_LATLA